MQYEDGFFGIIGIMGTANINPIRTMTPSGRLRSDYLTLGFSPCPNDTFIFYGLVHKKIDTGGLRFREMLLDVETLNHKALSAELDITKVSVHAYGYLRDKYRLLRSGGAMGRGCGPLIVAKTKTSAEALKGKKIAIPGKMTTASLLLRLYDSDLGWNVVVLPFDRIMHAVKDGSVDAGLIIHESRFTYPQYGLCCVMDLGKWWESETGLPLPLGCVIAKRKLGEETAEEIERQIKKSVEYAFSRREETRGYIKAHSQETDDNVIDRHINLYVNDYTSDFGNEGIAAVEELFRRAEEQRIIRRRAENAVIR